MAAITFVDEKLNRIVSYDDIKLVEMIDEYSGEYVKITCKDGFKTIISGEEWTKICIERM